MYRLAAHLTRRRSLVQTPLKGSKFFQGRYSFHRRVLLALSISEKFHQVTAMTFNEFSVILDAPRGGELIYIPKIWSGIADAERYCIFNNCPAQFTISQSSSHIKTALLLIHIRNQLYLRVRQLITIKERLLVDHAPWTCVDRIPTIIPFQTWVNYYWGYRSFGKFWCASKLRW